MMLLSEISMMPRGIEVIERFIGSKTGDMGECEDGLFISDKFIAVIDGVTSKGRLRWDGRKGGFFAKEIIMSTLQDLDGGIGCGDALAYLNNRLRERYGDIGFFIRNPEERLQAGLIIYSAARRQVWSFGDCHAVIDGVPHESKMRIDELVAEIRSVFLDLEMLAGKTIDELVEKDPSFEVVFPLLKRQPFFMNSRHEYGYNCLDGICGDFGMAKIVDVKPGTTVILASDGYPKPGNTLEESESYLEWLRINDPLCIRTYKGDKGFTNGKVSLDDRTYVRFTAV